MRFAEKLEPTVYHSAMQSAVKDAELRGWVEEFEAAARRPLELRLRYAFVKTYKPVLDDEPYRSFQTMQDYRDWCEASLPEWLGYRRV